jgi:hypothetical protein
MTVMYDIDGMISRGEWDHFICCFGPIDFMYQNARAVCEP